MRRTPPARLPELLDSGHLGRSGIDIRVRIGMELTVERIACGPVREDA
jgi:hypothetical protein